MLGKKKIVFLLFIVFLLLFSYFVIAPYDGKLGDEVIKETNISKIINSTNIKGLNITIATKNVELNAYPYLVKNGEIQNFEVKQKLNFDGKYKLLFKSKEDININIEYYNGSDWILFDFNKTNKGWITNTFDLNGINLSLFKLTPSHKNLLFNGIFEYNISLVSDDLMFEYLELDPYANVTGCVEDTNVISCTGKLTGNYLMNTTKNINITSCTIDAFVANLNPVTLIINTTKNVSIVNSFLLVNATNKTVQSTNLKLLGQNINISNSTIHAEAFSSATSLGIGSARTLITGSDITLMDGTRLYAHGGNYTGGGNNYGSPSNLTIKSTNNLILKSGTVILAYGGSSSSVTESDGGRGGNSTIIIQANNLDINNSYLDFASGFNGVRVGALGNDNGSISASILITNTAIFRKFTFVNLRGFWKQYINLSVGNELLFYDYVNVSLQRNTTNHITLLNQSAKLGIFNLDWLTLTNVTCQNGLNVGRSGRTDQAFNFNCGYTNLTESEYFFVASSINITLISPLDYTNLSNPINFTYNVSSHLNLANCSLIINGTYNTTNYAVTRNLPYQNFSITLPNSTYAWNVSCSDTSGYNANSSESRIVIINESLYQPPIYSSHLISPEIAYANTKLDCKAIFYGLDDNITVEFKWFNSSTNIEEIYSYNSNVTCANNTICMASNSFPARRTTHNSNVTCMVRANASNMVSSYFNTTRFINNSAPYFDSGSIVIIPPEPYDEDDLSCNWSTYGLHDIDNDAITITYDWFNSSTGIDYTDLNFNNVTFPSGNTSIGQYWKCVVVTNDNWDNGLNKTSASAVLVSPPNTAPIINIANVTTKRSISNATFPTNNNSDLLIGINWTDVDNDNATFYACKTDSWTQTRCTDGSFGSPVINSTDHNVNINYTNGNFTSVENTLYVYAFSDNALISASFAVPFTVNFPISTTITPSLPINGTNFGSSTTSTLLRWNNATDPDEDSIRYLIYGDSKSNPTTLVLNTTGSCTSSTCSETWTGLSGGTWYWKVGAEDEHGYHSTSNSSIYTFSVESLPSTPLGGGGGGAGAECVENSDCKEGYECSSGRCQIQIQRLIQAAQAGLCGNGVCEKDKGETLYTCQLDCWIPLVGWNADDILNCFNKDPTDLCILKEAPHIILFLGLIIGAILYGLYTRKRKEVPTQKKPFFKRFRI